MITDSHLKIRILMTNGRRLIVVAGPTGSGKTALGIALARHFSAPIISTDSRQVYIGIPIGTAQPTTEELSQAEHHLISFLPLEQDYNCGQYERDALLKLDQLFKTSSCVIAVGGSGLYIKALTQGMDELPDADRKIRDELQQRLSQQGLAPLLAELERLDPEYSLKVDRNNPSRVLRALEVCLQSGRAYSSFLGGGSIKRDFEILKVGIDMPRERLYQRINTRVDLMMEQGLEEEARSVYHLRHYNSLHTVGYSELFEYFDGNISLERAVELIKQNSRHYAKRQMTWFRRDPEIRWFEDNLPQPVIDYLLSRICE